MPNIKAQLEQAFYFGYITREKEEGPSIMDQIFTLYEPVLEQDFLNFLLAYWHSQEPPDITQEQRLKIFRHYYKPTKINVLEGYPGTEKKQTKKEKGGIDI